MVGDDPQCPERMEHAQMDVQQLEQTAQALFASDKGLLAMDESNPTCNKRFAALGIPQTAEARRAYRELIVTTPRLSNAISGAILFDETVRQQTQDGTPFVNALIDAGIIPGIKVDAGAKDLAGFPGEKVTEGLDGLRERLAEYAHLGLRFAKWRAVIAIGSGLPSAGCIDANAHTLARYAALCQEAGLVPIVEPEVLMDGDHTIQRCYDVTKEVLRAVFHQLLQQRVNLNAMILKPNMVLPGLACPTQVTADEAADATLRCLLETVPAAVPAIAFLSGGQSPELATARLRAINYWFKSKAPWALTFSFARAIQEPATAIWRGEESNVAAAQRALYDRASRNRAARRLDHYAVAEPIAVPLVADATVTPILVFDLDGNRIGTFQRTVQSDDGELVMIARDKRLGGGTIIVSARELPAASERVAGNADVAKWRLPYCELSILEAPQYSSNVDLHAYVEFWERLGTRNSNASLEGYLPTGSGSVRSAVELPDALLLEEVNAALHDSTGGSVNTHLARVSVKHGTVLLDGYQNTTEGRLAASEAAASVAGVKEVVNMLVIRAL
jgi:fructose-bisphosphate aldolase class I